MLKFQNREVQNHRPLQLTEQILLLLQKKKVSTNVRTKSGAPVIIGGLFQTETDVTEKRVPLLGKIPLLGNLFKTKNETAAETEFVIYLVPFAEKNDEEVLNEELNLKRLQKKYETYEDVFYEK